MINDGSTCGFYSQYHEGRIGGDIIGNLTRGCVIDRLSTMRRQERMMYNYRSSSPTSSKITADDSIPPLNSSWREKICHWSFNVIDHFDLSREVVAVSMSLFDRYLATRGNRCNGSTALLASLTTLHIAIKVHEVRKIKLTTLANLSRGQFGTKHIEEMEWQVLNSLNWHIHPPTSMSFLSHLLLLLPEKVSDASKEEIYAMSRYVTELSVCDSSFVDMNPSAVAFSAILNSFEDRRYRRLISPAVREQFFRAIATHVGLSLEDEHVLLARPKLKRLLITSLGTENLPQDQNVIPQTSQPASSQARDQTVASVTSSVGGMSIQDSSFSSKAGGSLHINDFPCAKGGDDSSMSSKLSVKSQSSSYDSITSQRRMLVPNGPGRALVGPSSSNSQTVMLTVSSPAFHFSSCSSRLQTG